jgi:hypothetical protein
MTSFYLCSVRLVLHYQISDDDVQYALTCFKVDIQKLTLFLLFTITVQVRVCRCECH